MARSVVLYSMDISHYCVSAERMLAYKGIRYRKVYAPYHDRQALLRATGQDYVPALVWDGRAVPWEAIPSFLEERVASPTLFPDGTRALAEILENWGHQVLEERVWRAVVTDILPALKSDEERWVFEEMQARSRGSWAVLRARRREFERDLQPYLGLVDGMLEGRDWLLDRPSVADFGIYGGLSPWMTAGRAIPAKWRNLRRWAGRIAALEDRPMVEPVPSEGHRASARRGTKRARSRF